MKGFARFLFFSVLLAAVFAPLAVGVEIEYQCERIMNGWTYTYIDLDTGISPRFLNRIQEGGSDVIKKWMEQNNVDIGIKVKGDTCYISHFKSYTKQIDNKKWGKVTPEMFKADSDLDAGKLGFGNITKQRKDLPRTYLFKTSEGGMGVFQIKNGCQLPGQLFRENSISLRYRLIKKDDGIISSGTKVKVADEADRKKIEELIAGIARAQRPAENLRVSFAYGDSQKSKYKSKDDCIYTLVGDRSRNVEVSSYYHPIKEKRIKRYDRTSVYDGLAYQIVTKDGNGKLDYAKEGFRDKNKKGYYGLLFGFLDFNDRQVFNRWTFSLSDSQKPGIVILEASSRDFDLNTDVLLRLFVDTKRGCNVVKFERLHDGKPRGGHSEYELKKYANDLWFVSGHKRIYKSRENGGGDEISVVVQDVELELNVKVDDDYFKLEVPKDIEVDAITRPSD